MHGIATEVVCKELWGHSLQEKEAQRDDPVISGSVSLWAVTDWKTTEKLVRWAELDKLMKQEDKNWNLRITKKWSALINTPCF